MKIKYFKEIGNLSSFKLEFKHLNSIIKEINDLDCYDGCMCSKCVEVNNCKEIILKHCELEDEAN